ncbi:MAG: TonB-dependent receptor [Sphingomonas sp. SCN 67-18]|uniref:TonB-dependent receptor plug domain-containing protein n=1 Tax=uncultured Sphingomonas sp. TaxID=158754 RepID=UPI00086E9C05|nr:TonB-dependent receptor [Sphingomonas sp. SCN 67-18]ODU20156.1 MAG: TonB-dependent receptor [Sphingomonas sp. SCN 67-18]
MNNIRRRAFRIMLGVGCCIPALATPAWAQDTQGEQADAPEIIVTGSRIPTIRDEGPSAVTTVDSNMIRANGYTSVPDLLAAMTQNSGETQSPQSGSSADFTPGAQQVDLRGLGPNHTLVLINGRRIADFPLPYIGRSNFTDISNIPVSLIDRVEILSGAASAIYGSDAIAGVVNFKMKEKLDGITLDYRHGRTEHGGGMSHRFTATGGWSTERFNIAGGIEYLDQRPLWAYDRRIQDSTDDSPVARTAIARRTFLRYNIDSDTYIDPGAATCAGLSNLDGGSLMYASRPRYGDFDPELDDYGPGYYCGSKTSIGYGTIISSRKGFNSFGTASYELSDNATLFADFQLGISKVKLMYDVTAWAFEQTSSSSDNSFYNAFIGDVDDWSRLFTPEETGGLQMQRSKQTTYSITPGIRGNFGKSWNYEASFNYSRYKSVVRWPQIINSKAQALYLGEQLGIDEDSGYPIFNADPATFYRALTRAEYDSISADTIYHPVSWTSNAQVTLTNGELFQLPAGPVGVAVVAEYGKQGYNLNPDPLALTDYYFSWKDSDGVGKRSHGAVGGEVRVPLLDFISLSGAGRYDTFRFAGRTVDKFTYSGGVEIRPMTSLLLRAAYGTAFRAPDLHYVFTGPGNVERDVTDYYMCRQDDPDASFSDCGDYEIGIVANRTGNRALKAETGKTLTAGVVFSPAPRLSLSVDYFRVRLDNQVDDLSVDQIARDEADCRPTEEGGTTVLDPNSQTCREAFARITRFVRNGVEGDIASMAVNPINIARERTSGIDIAFRGTLPTGIGNFTLSVAHSHVFKHSFQQYPGDPVENKLAADSGYYLPRDKSNASITWKADAVQLTVSGTRLGKLPNFDEDAFIKASYLFNATLQYDFNDYLRGSLTVKNLADKMPVKDPTWSSYPYYNTSWFDSVGRSMFLQLTYKIGGTGL